MIYFIREKEQDKTLWDSRTESETRFTTTTAKKVNVTFLFRKDSVDSNRVYIHNYKAIPLPVNETESLYCNASVPATTDDDDDVTIFHFLLSPFITTCLTWK